MRGRGQAGRTRCRMKGLSSPGPFSRSRCWEWPPYPGARLGPGVRGGSRPTITRTGDANHTAGLFYSVTQSTVLPAPQVQPSGRRTNLSKSSCAIFTTWLLNEVTFLNFITQGCTRGFVDSSPDGADGCGKDAVFPERRNFTQGAAGDALGRGHPTGWTPTPPASTCTSPHSWKIRIPTVSCT